MQCRNIHKRPCITCNKKRPALLNDWQQCPSCERRRYRGQAIASQRMADMYRELGADEAAQSAQARADGARLAAQRPLSAM